MTKHRAYAINVAPRIGYDWRVMCRACGAEGRPVQVDLAYDRRSDAVKAAEVHNRGVLA